MPLPALTESSCCICFHTINSLAKHSPRWIIDVELFLCGHHFHWSCIAEYVYSASNARDHCPFCHRAVLNLERELMATVRNKRGGTGVLNLGAELDREKSNLVAEMERKLSSKVSRADFTTAIVLAYTYPLCVQSDLAIRESLNCEIQRGAAFMYNMSCMKHDLAELYISGRDSFSHRPVNPNLCLDPDRIGALHKAALRNDVNGVRLLLQYGADSRIKIWKGSTALDLAKAADAHDVRRLLESDGRSRST